MAISTYKVFLMHKASSGDTYTKLIDIKDFPDLGSAPSTVDVTTLSHHMKVLGDCGLTASRKEGKWNYYTINCDKFKEFKEYISGISCCDTAIDACCCGK